MKMKVKVLGTLTLVVSLLLVACGSGGSQKPDSAPPPRATSTPAAPRPTNTQPPVPATAEAGEYNLGQASDLSGLNSYRAHSTFQWESIKAGQKETGSWEVLEDFVRQPPAHRLVWTGTGAGELKTEEGGLEFIQIGKDTYMNTGSGWIAMTTSEEDIFGGNLFLSNPLHLVSGNRGKLVQKNVMVNGVSTNHYTFDESSLGADLGLGVIAKAKGDVWVSPEFNVVVKYGVHYEGKNLTIGGGEEGKLDLAFDLTDINKPITIQAPEGVGPAMPEDIPVIDGATELTAISGIITYKTTRSVEEVTAFYEAQMPAEGWTKGESVIPGMMSFTKAERTAQVMIETEDGETSVIVMVGE